MRLVTPELEDRTMMKSAITSNYPFVRDLLAVLIFSALVAACTPEKSSADNVSPDALIKPQGTATFAAKMKCTERGEAFLKRERAVDVPSIVKNEQFTYNQSLDTCLAYFEVYELGAGTTYNIVDTLSNKTIYFHTAWERQAKSASWDSLCKVSDGCLSDDALRKKRTELFSGTL
jgi:hypothetical protein